MPGALVELFARDRLVPPSITPSVRSGRGRRPAGRNICRPRRGSTKSTAHVSTPTDASDAAIDDLFEADVDLGRQIIDVQQSWPSRFTKPLSKRCCLLDAERLRAAPGRRAARVRLRHPDRQRQRMCPFARFRSDLRWTHLRSIAVTQPYKKCHIRDLFGERRNRIVQGREFAHRDGACRRKSVERRHWRQVSVSVGF